MDRVAQLRKKQEELDKVSRELDELKKNKQVQKELAFQEDLEALLKKHGKTLSDLPKPGRATKAAAPARTRRKRKLKVYVNPHSGEKIQTRGGNHKILKEWKAQYGADEVESWVK